MCTNGPNPQESVGEQPSIAHSCCHDCDRHEEIFETKRPEDALELANKAAIEHGRARGHEVDAQLVAQPLAMITTGPDVADTEVRRR